ncbi:MAG: hypothetical protein FJ294_02665 [Planctomycetes bacterium]|nr:hypothetical protein [Planctomycetota bacterium]
MRIHHALVALALLATACQGTRKLADPLIEVRGPESTELGVATDYGLVFLGRSARSGPVDVTAWFGDGPSTEQAVVEPLGGGLFTAEPEIRFPRVPISFQTPPPGTRLLLIGRVGRVRWQEEVEVLSDARVEGLLVRAPQRLATTPAEGAGLFIVNPLAEHELKLVGLISGRIELESADGAKVEYLAAFGPDQLWRLVAHRRNDSKRRKFVYRDDIL